MDKNESVKSEIGSEAAWRGFSTQTLYIAKRSHIQKKIFWPTILKEIRDGLKRLQNL